MLLLCIIDYRNAISTAVCAVLCYQQSCGSLNNQKYFRLWPI